MSQKPLYRIAIVAVLAVAVVVILSSKKPQTETPAAQAVDSTAQPAAEAPAPESAAPAARPAAGEAAPAQPAAGSRKLPRLLDLGSGSCIPCKMMAPILEDLKEEQAGTIDVEFIDVWKDQDAGKQYGINVIPTQIFFDSAGKEFFRHEGFFSKEEILAVFKKHGIQPARRKAKE